MQIAGADFNPVTFTMAVLYRGMGREREERGDMDMASGKDLTPAPLCCGLSVACLLRAGFGDWGLSGPSPLQEALWDCPGMQLMH